ncbi:dicarboxylate/amino acid:cation symporter [Sphingopyxis indica]|nr:dicarboxylate/amino acid:cation symporter [Sphingopyxis indica]
MNGNMTRYVLASIGLAIVAGLALRAGPGTDSEATKNAATMLHLPAEIFLHLIKMIIAPLVFSTLVYGIAHSGDSSGLGRIGFRAMAWFLIASLVSLTIGLILVNLFEPGIGLDLHTAQSSATVELRELDLRGFILHIFPASMTEAMAENEILQIVVFSLFVGFGLCAIGDRGKPLVVVVESLVALMLKVTEYVMAVAPLAVFSALSSAMLEHGVGILGAFAKLIGEYYMALAMLWLVLLGAGVRFLGRDLPRLVKYLREPLMIAFSTASSEAALPKLMERLDGFGVPRRVYSFVLPLGYSFNLDGSMMSATFTTIFICQAYGIHVPLGMQITMLLMLMVTSKGMAAVPRASLVVVAATLAQFGLPVEGVALVLAIDQFMDMGRTATNVLGNGIATTVVGRYDQQSVSPERPAMT